MTGTGAGIMMTGKLMSVETRGDDASIKRGGKTNRVKIWLITITGTWKRSKEKDALD